MHITVLLVDDFEAMRQSVCSMLLESGKFQVIGQAADGLEAVQKAEELQPDLILLDIGLPNLNGIAAVPQIRKLAPKSKIVLLTQNTSPETVEAALSSGAHGYVVKWEAGKELFEALEAVHPGREIRESYFKDARKGQSSSQGSRRVTWPHRTHCHRRIRADTHAAIGVWYNSRQCDRQRYDLRLAPLDSAVTTGVSPSSPAWLR